MMMMTMIVAPGWALSLWVVLWNTNSSDSDDSTDDSESSDSDDSSSNSSKYVEESFQVIFVPEKELQ